MAAARTIEHPARLTYAVQVAVAGEFYLARLAQTHGQPSTAALLRHALTIGPGDARSRVLAARSVLPQDAISGGEIPPALLALGHGLRGPQRRTSLDRGRNDEPHPHRGRPGDPGAG